MRLGGSIPLPGGAFVESYTRGDLVFCNGSSSKTVAAEKIQPNPTQWEGMGGVMGNNACLDLAMTSQSPPAFSIYVCPTPNGASEISNYLPSNFCQAEQAGQLLPRRDRDRQVPEYLLCRPG